MNVSAINATPLKPAFAGAEQEDNGLKNVNTVLTKSSELGDSFQKDEDKKSKVGTLISVAGAFASMFALGRTAASFALKKFPSLITKLPNLAQQALSKTKGFISKAKTTKLGTKISTSKVAGKLKEQGAKLAENPKFQGIGKTLAGKMAPYIEKINALPMDHKIKNLAGIATMGVLGTQVATVDKDGNGIKDIAEKDINAYTSAVSSLSVLGEIADALK